MRAVCIIPVYNGLRDLQRLLDSLDQQDLKVDIAIVDSQSDDGSWEVAQRRATIFHQINKSKFNHGGTRQLMVDMCDRYDLLVFLTQDAVLEGTSSLRNLLSSFDDISVGAAYGRQLPHTDADIFGRLARQFNYPARSSINTASDIPRLGIKTTFISNSYAAYRRELLLKVGGFPSDVILAEDMYVAAKMILAGNSVAYVSEAECRHSHNYSSLQEFKRYFDVGVFHARQNWIKKEFGGAGGEGYKFVKSELVQLGVRNIHLWPLSIIRNASKLLGYKLGSAEALLPIWVKRRCSMHAGFWR